MSIFSAIGDFFKSIFSKLFSFIAPDVREPVNVSRVEDLSVQSNAYGTVFPRTYGIGRNKCVITWVYQNQIEEVKIKGPRGYAYFGEFAAAFHHGEIDHVRKIWFESDLIYSATSSQSTPSRIDQKGGRALIFKNGESDQKRWERIDLREGSGIDTADVPAWRDIAYLGIQRWPLEKYGNSINNLQVDVEYFVDAGGGSSVISAFESGDIEQIDLPAEITDIVAATGESEIDVPFQDENGTYIWYASRTWPSSDTAELACWIVDWNGNVHKILTSVVPFAGSGFTRGSISTIKTFRWIWTDQNAVALWAVDSANDKIWISVCFGAKQEFGTSVAELDYNGYRNTVTFAVDGSNLQGYTWNDLLPFDSGALKGDYFYSWYNDGTDTYLYRWRAANNEGASFGGSSNIAGAQTVLVISAFEADTSWGGVVGNSLFLFDNTTNIPIKIIDLDSFAVAESTTVLALFGRYIGIQNFGFSGDYLYATFSSAGTYRIKRLGVSDYKAVETIGNAWFLSSNINFQVAGDRISFLNRITEKLYRVDFNNRTISDVPLSSIITAEVELSGLITASDIDVTEMTDTVGGYRISKVASIRENLAALQKYSPFDIIQDGYKIKFKPRGGSSVLTIDTDDLDPDTQWTQQREMDAQLPRRINVKYFDAGRAGEAGIQYAERESTEAVDEVTVDLAMYMTADRAAQCAEVLLQMAWDDRNTCGFTLPPSYRALQPGDVVTVPFDDVTHTVLIRDIDFGGNLKISGTLYKSSSYTSAAVGQEGEDFVDEVIPDSPLAFLKLVDCPVVNPSIQDAYGFLAAGGAAYTSWQGGTLYRSRDDSSWNTVSSFQNNGAWGVATDTLAANNGYMIDPAELTVRIEIGSFSSASDFEAFCNGENYAAYGVNGRWEMVKFQTVVDNGDNTYTISNFMRGLRGTEHNTGLHVVGDDFVLISDPDTQWVGAESGDIDTAIDYRCASTAISVPDAINYEFTYAAENLKTFSPVHAEASRDGSDNISGTFLIRSRVDLWQNGLPWRSGESSTEESYEIDVMDGSTVVRTIETAYDSDGEVAFTYSAADQTTDFGSPQSSLDVKIYHLNEQGRGTPLEVTL